MRPQSYIHTRDESTLLLLELLAKAINKTLGAVQQRWVAVEDFEALARYYAGNLSWSDRLVASLLYIRLNAAVFNDNDTDAQRRLQSALAALLFGPDPT